MINLIDIYMNYYINRLSQYALCFFNEEELDKEFTIEILKEYMKVFINFKYYNILSSIENSQFQIEDLKKELDGKRVEILDNYASRELEEDNNIYSFNRKIIDKAMEVTLIVIQIDDYNYKDIDNTNDIINNLINKNNKKYIENNTLKLINLVKETYKTINKFFKEENNYFNINYRLLDENRRLFVITLDQDIKYLDVNYKKSLIDKVYITEKLDKDKTEILLEKLSKDILYKILNKETIENYIVEISDEILKGNELYIKDIIDNPLLNNHIILSITHEIYKERNKCLKNDYRLICNVDLSHIPDFKDKINKITGLGVFEYVIVKDYKQEDLEDLKKYDEEHIIIDKE